MGRRTEYAPGSFCWVDLATTDAAAAKAFYGELFGWEAVDTPAGEAGTYSMLQLGDSHVCALYETGPEMRERGVPPSWKSYVSVEDADAAAARARELGGSVHADAFDVMDAGRMAVIQDPTGGLLAVWQPRAHVGAAVVNELGALTWNDLSTPDPETAARFYSDLFGWEVETVDPESGYRVIRNGERTNGGIMRSPSDEAPAHWYPYFVVSSTDEALARVEGLGGRRLTSPIDVPAGRFAVVQDPQGAVFAVLQGELDD